LNWKRFCSGRLKEESMIKRVRTGGTAPTDGSPWVLDVRTFDISETIIKMIRSCPPGLVAVSLRAGGSRHMIPAAERAARKRGARILWVLLTKPYLTLD
jgi:hypothetical protein